LTRFPPLRYRRSLLRIGNASESQEGAKTLVSRDVIIPVMRITPRFPRLSALGFPKVHAWANRIQNRDSSRIKGARFTLS
jgi:hypothetical protein